MAEIDFERRLERMFGEAPAFPDDAAFAARVESRLDRGWNLRRGLIGIAGLAGGVVGGSQLILSNFVQQVEEASAGSSRIFQAGIAQARPGLDLFAMVQSDWTMVWVASALAVVALGFVLTRVMEEF